MTMKKEKKISILLISFIKGVNGGSLTIRDSQGKIIRTIVEVVKKDGADVKLPYTIDCEILNKSNE